MARIEKFAKIGIFGLVSAGIGAGIVAAHDSSTDNGQSIVDRFKVTNCPTNDMYIAPYKGLSLRPEKNLMQSNGSDAVHLPGGTEYCRTKTFSGSSSIFYEIPDDKGTIFVTYNSGLRVLSTPDLPQRKLSSK